MDIALGRVGGLQPAEDIGGLRGHGKHAERPAALLPRDFLFFSPAFSRSWMQPSSARRKCGWGKSLEDLGNCTAWQGRISTMVVL